MTANPQVDAWLQRAVEDARRRGLSDLAPMLETLSRSTAQLREADRLARCDPDDTPTREKDARP